MGSLKNASFKCQKLEIENNTNIISESRRNIELRGPFPISQMKN